MNENKEGIAGVGEVSILSRVEIIEKVTKILLLCAELEGRTGSKTFDDDVRDSARWLGRDIGNFLFPSKPENEEGAK